MRFDVETVRKDFPLLNQEMNGYPLVYLDNAATSQKPTQVIAAIDHYYRSLNANVHRGIYRLSEEVQAPIGSGNAARWFVSEIEKKTLSLVSVPVAV